jgi:hypothetical protein
VPEEGQLDTGQTIVPKLALIHGTAKLLQVSHDSVDAGVHRALDGHHLVLEDISAEPIIVTPSLRSADVNVAAHFRRPQRPPPPWGHIRAESQPRGAAEPA